jgi:hypothetical protein
MLEYLKQKSFGDRMKDTGYLLKNSFTIVGANTGIVKPTVHMAVYSLLMTSLVVGSLVMFLLRWHVGMGVLALLFTVLILLPYKYFYRTRQKACQSWMTYQAITGVVTAYPEARRHTAAEKGRLRFIALVDLLVAYAGSQGGQNREGISAFITNLFLSALMEVWDLVNHYMIPGVVIEQKPLKEIVPQLKALRHNVPATLAGVFGIDFAGDVLRGLLVPVYLIALAASVGLSYLLGPSMPHTSWTIQGHAYAWVPVVIILYVIFCVGGMMTACVGSIKTIYFTIFYTAITRPEAIVPELRQELTHYLLLGETAPAGTSQQESNHE